MQSFMSKVGVIHALLQLPRVSTSGESPGDRDDIGRKERCIVNVNMRRLLVPLFPLFPKLHFQELGKLQAVDLQYPPQCLADTRSERDKRHDCLDLKTRARKPGMCWYCHDCKMDGLSCRWSLKGQSSTSGAVIICEGCWCSGAVDCCRPSSKCQRDIHKLSRPAMAQNHHM